MARTLNVDTFLAVLASGAVDTHHAFTLVAAKAYPRICHRLSTLDGE